MKNEMALKDRWNALAIADMLLEEEYVVMLSKEDNFTILNFQFYPAADRAGVVFMPRDEYDELEDKLCDAIFTDLRNDIKKGRITDLSEI